jgi:two-component system, OmpR family, sensor histidine kinase TctE
MRLNWLRRQRLAQALLLLLVPALLVISLAELRVTAQHVQQAADAAYDRSLLGALKAVDASVSTESGGLSLELPYRLFEFFELTASGRVNYRVATADGLVELGSADLPAPPHPLQLGVPQCYDGRYFGAPVRVAAYSRLLDRVAPGARSRELIIQVAESTQSRAEFKRALLAQAAGSSAVFLLLAVLCSIGVVIFVLHPLASVSRELSERRATDMTPIAADGLPADVRPLVEAMNDHMHRADALGAQQRAFVEDASHQLRTHLTTLRMQVDYGLRATDRSEMQAAVEAFGTELQRATRSTNQLLSLARSDAAPLHPSWFDARELLAEVAMEFLPAVRHKGLDLGLEGDDIQVWGDRLLLREAITNLLANAVAYVPSGSITLRATEDEQGWTLHVEDTGPGLPPDLQPAAGTRFLRRHDGAVHGSGLGLAIARAVAVRHGGTLSLDPPSHGSGLHAALWWPRAPHQPGKD